MNKTHWYPGVMTPIRTGWYECHYANTAKDQESGAVVMRLWEPNAKVRGPEAALSPEAPSRLTGYAGEDK